MKKKMLRAFALALALLMAFSAAALAEGGNLTVSNIALTDARGGRVEFKPALTFGWTGTQEKGEVSAALTLGESAAKAIIGIDGQTLYGYFDGGVNRYAFDLSKASEALGGLVVAGESSVDTSAIQEMVAAYARLIAKSGDRAYGEALSRKMIAGMPVESAAEAAPAEVCGQSYDLYRHSVTLDGAGIVGLFEVCKEADEDFAAYWAAYEKLLAQSAQGMTVEQMLTDGDRMKISLQMNIWTQDADPAVQTDVMYVEGVYALDVKQIMAVEYPADYAADYAEDGPSAGYAAEDTLTDEAAEWAHVEMPFASGMIRDESGILYDYQMNMKTEGADAVVTVNVKDDLKGAVAVTGDMTAGQGADAVILKGEYAQQPVEGGWDGKVTLTIVSDPSGAVGEGAFTCDLSCRGAYEAADAPEKDVDVTHADELSEELLGQMKYDLTAFTLKAGGICMRDPVLGALIRERVQSPFS